INSNSTRLANKILNESARKWKSVTKPFHSPLKSLNQLPEQQKSYEHNYQTEDRMDGNMIVKNYYITADNVTIN
ncbi:17907_t:CDS:1, partial [Gigaspora margarita]